MAFKSSDVAGRLKKRFLYIWLAFMGILAIIVVRLFYIEIFNGEEYGNAAARRSRVSTTIEAKRGSICDRNNVVLASSTVEYNLILDPKEILTENRNYLANTAALIQKCFGISASEVAEKANNNKESHYVVLKRGLSYSEVKDFMYMMESATADEIRDFLGISKDDEERVELAGAWLEDSFKRKYPFGTLASSVIGFTQDGVGIYGIEKYFNDELTGTDGKKYTYISNDKTVENVYHEAENGYNVQLTIDYNIQAIVEKYIKQTLEETGAKTVAVTIQNPNNGEFLAMADSGQFDPNSPRKLEGLYSQEKIDEMNDEETSLLLTENWKNYCVSETYEPGSTYKAFTVAGALESGAIKGDEMPYCEGSVNMRDYVIHCANIYGHEYITIPDALSQSCNMAMMYIAEQEGVDTFCKYQSQFGFGTVTRIELPTEMSCRSLLFNRTNMTDIDLATNSFGQNFNVTMVQLSSAFCSIVNGGTYYQPHIVKGLYNAEGDLIKSSGKTVVSNPVSKDTCDYVKNALRLTVTEGTGTAAAVPGYITAGKTGTAEKGAREDDLWIASFIGFAPFENPEVVCYVVIDEPEDGDDGSSAYACELFSKIMSEVLPYLNSTPASKDSDPTGLGSPERIDYYDYQNDNEDNSDDQDNYDYTDTNYTDYNYEEDSYEW